MLSPQDHDRLQAYLVGELSREEVVAIESQLKNDPELADALILASREEAIYGDWARVAGQTSQFDSSRTSPPLPSVGRANNVSLGVIAAALFSLAAVFVLWLNGPIPPQEREPLARLEQASGQVFAVDGDARRRIFAGDMLYVGQGLETVGDESAAEVVYPDGTRLEFDGDVKVQEFTDGANMSKRVVLTAGNVRADVAKQPAGYPMILKTANAEVVVLGTKFDLSGNAAATYVETSEGKVRLIRDGRSVEVPAGFETTADGGELSVQPSPPRYRQSRLKTDGNHRTTQLSPGGRTLLVSRFESSTLELWDVAAGKFRESFAPGKPIEVTALSADGRFLAAGGAGKVYVSDFETFHLGQTPIRKRQTLDVPERLQAVGFSADGFTLFTLTGIPQQGLKLQAWDWIAGRPLNESIFFYGETWSFSASGLSLAIGSARDHTLTVWDLATLRKRAEWKKRGYRTICLGISPDDARLAVSSMDGSVKVYDIDAMREERVFFPPGGSVQGLTFSPDGARLAMGMRFATVRMWSLADGKQLYVLEGDRRPGATATIRPMQFSPDQKTLVTSESQDMSVVRIWDLPAE